MAEEHGLYLLAHGNRSNSSIGGTAIVIWIVAGNA
jgi:hypothetical protein